LNIAGILPPFGRQNDGVIRDDGWIAKKTTRSPYDNLVVRGGFAAIEEAKHFRVFFCLSLPKTGFQKKSFGRVQNLYNFFIKSQDAIPPSAYKRLRE
jgi:hypothetical protein